MIRKWISVFLCLWLCVATAVSAAAAELPLVIDQAELLTDSEVQTLSQEALQLFDTYQMHVVILTVENLGGSSAQSAADNYYDQNGFDEDGVLLLLAMDDREWYISTYGDAIYALSDYALYEIEDIILPYLQNGDYCGAFDAFLSSLPYYFDAYESGNNVDGYIPPEDRYYGHTQVVYADQGPNVGRFILMGCGIGLIAAVIVILIMRGSMNTKRPQYSAGDYMKDSSFRMRLHQDIFLYSNVSKIRKPEPSQNSGGGGGGSGVHISSGGRSHGGRGGRF